MKNQSPLSFNSKIFQCLLLTYSLIDYFSGCACRSSAPFTCPCPANTVKQARQDCVAQAASSASAPNPTGTHLQSWSAAQVRDTFQEILQKVCTSPKMIRDYAHLAVRSTNYKNVAPNLTAKQKKSDFAVTNMCALLAFQDHCDCFRLPVLSWSIPS